MKRGPKSSLPSRRPSKDLDRPRSGPAHSRPPALVSCSRSGSRRTAVADREGVRAAYSRAVFLKERRGATARWIRPWPRAYFVIQLRLHRLRRPCTDDASSPAPVRVDIARVVTTSHACDRSRTGARRGRQRPSRVWGRGLGLHIARRADHGVSHSWVLDSKQTSRRCPVAAPAARGQTQRSSRTLVANGDNAWISPQS